MVKIGEETLENGQIMEIFQEGKAIIKTPKHIEQVETRKTVYTKADFLLKFITQEGRYLLKTLQFPDDMSIEYRMTIVDIVAQFDATVEDRMDLSDSRVYDSLYFLSFLGFTNPNADEILANVPRIVKEI